jgi:hypothetical protein
LLSELGLHKDYNITWPYGYSAPIRTFHAIALLYFLPLLQLIAVWSNQVNMSNRRARNPQPTMVTANQLPLPRNDDPIWTMGFGAVQVALAVCDAFASFRMGTVSVK